MSKAVYRLKTKISGQSGTTHNYAEYVTTAANMKEAIKKTEAYLKKRNSYPATERVDEVTLIAPIDF